MMGELLQRVPLAAGVDVAAAAALLEPPAGRGAPGGAPGAPGGTGAAPSAADVAFVCAAAARAAVLHGGEVCWADIERAAAEVWRRAAVLETLG